ncbi:unnamed protein product [Lactuca saligna]|uniref:Uncharacterized protein n=1 Tax=Lactuca saligna TaxID=75948 RepID=A0AA36EC65_LACSI|nr:unnamed protein product [Lactuca saligna]
MFFPLINPPTIKEERRWVEDDDLLSVLAYHSRFPSIGFLEIFPSYRCGSSLDAITNIVSIEIGDILLKDESDNTVTSVYSLEAEFARFLWVFGMNTYEILKEHKNLIACSYRMESRIPIMLEWNLGFQ